MPTRISADVSFVLQSNVPLQFVALNTTVSPSQQIVLDAVIDGIVAVGFDLITTEFDSNDVPQVFVQVAV